MGGTATLLLLLAAEAANLTLPFGESSRPRACVPASAPGAEASAPSAWDRARQGPLEGLCLGLARTQVRLRRAPAQALAAARQLSKDWPARPEPRVLEARALLALGDAAGSWQSWQAAFDLGHQPRDVSAHALRDYALAAVATGHGAIAIATYRRLVSLLDAWPDPRHVQRAYLEAAAASLRAGTERVDEALGYLAAAHRNAGSTGLRAYVTGLRAFALALRGAASPEANRVEPGEAWHFAALTRAEALPSYWPQLPRHELCAVASLLIEDQSLAEAAELWDLYVNGLAQVPAEPALVKLAHERQRRLAARGGGAR